MENCDSEIALKLWIIGGKNKWFDFVWFYWWQKQIYIWNEYFKN